MKLSKSFPAVLAGLLAAFQAIASDSTKISAEGSVVFPSMVGVRDISTSVLSNANRIVGVSEQVAYLTGCITNTARVGVDREFQIASAFWLLGVAKQTNSIPILVSHISFRHNATGTYPAAEALGDFGEDASPALLFLVCNSTNKVDLSHAVRALIAIKGSGYDKFVEEQRNALPKKDWVKLVKFAVRP